MDASQFDKMSSQADQIMGPFADVLLRQAGFPPSADKSALVVLDTACGSGVVASHIMGLLASRRTGDEGDQTHLDLDLDLTCADISEAMVSNATRRIETSGWRNTRAVIADAMVCYTSPSPHWPLSLAEITDSERSDAGYQIPDVALHTRLLQLRPVHPAGRARRPERVSAHSPTERRAWVHDLERSPMGGRLPRRHGEGPFSACVPLR